MVIQTKSRIRRVLKARLSNEDDFERGMGLVEIVVALFILAIGLTATAGEFVTVDRVTAQTAQRQAAINIAAQQQSKLEGFESLNWEFSAGIPTSITSSTQAIGSTTYTAQTIVTDCSSSSAIISILSKVTVTWHDSLGTQSYDEFSSLHGPSTVLKCP
ncbi:MAG: prepilin-type N-terminal cleavage/methylation domain-containing protein [Acidimicrobiales bacterium]|nr:prepilin-type N-terminal cleavage/methylation domain-containing protein [Acidimicrobiales bacterium]